MSDKVEVRAKKMTRDRVGHYITIKEDIAILNMYTLNDNIAKYVKQKLLELKEEMDKSTIKDFNTLSQQLIEQLDRKICRNTEELNSIMDQQI